ncbi:helix-turn-helix domain-containing protein [Paenibacillus filicis]|uniref:Helix-turn-helix domain-containing protein n=1 Tax=Paenibacillus filicis TaxID=669464 RepID=A0ABU9DHJ3_9BACL
MGTRHTPDTLAGQQADVSGCLTLNGATIEFIEVVLEYPAGATGVPLHTHTWFEMNVVFEGTMFTSFEGSMLEMRAGDFIVVPPGQVHAHRYVPDRPHRGGCLRWKIKEAACEETDSLAGRIAKLANWQPGVYTDNHGITGLFHTLLDECSRGASPLSLRLSAFKIILALCELQHPQPRHPEPGSHSDAALLRKVDIYLEDYYKSKWHAVELAASLHMSYGHLARTYKRLTGKTLVDRMLEIRLAKAAELLKMTRLSMQEIADRTGFASVHYFSRAFKKVYQASPRTYRSGFTQ